jgi:hypothetical protein
MKLINIPTYSEKECAKHVLTQYLGYFEAISANEESKRRTMKKGEMGL